MLYKIKHIHLVYRRTFPLCYLHSTYTPASHLRWFMGCSIWGSEAGRRTLQPDSSSWPLSETRLLLQHLAETVGVTVPPQRHSKADEAEHLICLSGLKQSRTAQRLSRSEPCVSILLMGCEDAALWTTSERHLDEWKPAWSCLVIFSPRKEKLERSLGLGCHSWKRYWSTRLAVINMPSGISYHKLLIPTSCCSSCVFVADNIFYNILKTDRVTVSKGNYCNFIFTPAVSKMQAEQDVHTGPVHSEQIKTQSTMGGIYTDS